ncbi:RluA family pseudouridine synthase [Lacticaseibacillus sp. N501-2]|uniref:RluA family pseudouridine synthase n=1 Tax=Lacticaseibacillus salsurae TaxID=3367729 RepID=UPI0038B2A238
MPEFSLSAPVLHDFDSVTAQLTAWQVPKAWRYWLRKHQGVTVNGQYRYGNLPVHTGETIQLHLTANDPTAYVHQIHPLDIVYENNQVLVVNKPAGVKPHPNQPGEVDTLMNWVAAYLAPGPAYITHRLDMLTSGLTLIAKDPLTQSLINQQLASKTMAREYVALVSGQIPDGGVIDQPIGLDPDDKRKRMVRADGDHAVTHYQVIARRGDVARVWLTLETGRTHQLRVHLAKIGFPILGDPLYGDVHVAPRLMLHAAKLSWRQPLSDKMQTVTSAAPF